jgi:integrase
MLNDLAIKALKPRQAAYKASDEKGLYLLINPNGSRLWRYKYRVLGKEKLLSFGGYPAVSLAKARAARDAARKLLDGDEVANVLPVDPMVKRKETKLARLVASETSFQAVARQWWEQWRLARSPRHAEYVIRRLEADVFPLIGAIPVNTVQPKDLVAMCKHIASRGAKDIAARCLQTSGQVFRYGIAHGLAARNPAAEIKPAEIIGARKKVHFASIEVKELPDLLRQIQGYRGAHTTRIAMQLMAYTFVRTSELIGARWEEFDLEAARWNIPPERMKMRIKHIVPLASQTIELLRVLQLQTGHGPNLFPSERGQGKPMSNNTILKALERMGYKGRMTGHGFRSLASTQLNEMGFRPDIVELQLAHQEQDEVKAAYNYAQHMEKRTAMMQTWANFLDAATTEKVVPIRAKKKA